MTPERERQIRNFTETAYCNGVSFVHTRELLAELDSLRAEIVRQKDLEQKYLEISHQLEFDRTAVADAVTAVKKELTSRSWLTQGRGPYEWDDDRYREEFSAAGEAILKALEPLEKIAQDWKQCPQTGKGVAAARVDLKRQLELRERALSECKQGLRQILSTLSEGEQDGTHAD